MRVNQNISTITGFLNGQEYHQKQFLILIYAHQETVFAYSDLESKSILITFRFDAEFEFDLDLISSLPLIIDFSFPNQVRPPHLFPTKRSSLPKICCFKSDSFCRRAYQKFRSETHSYS